MANATALVKVLPGTTKITDDGSGVSVSFDVRVTTRHTDGSGRIRDGDSKTETMTIDMGEPKSGVRPSLSQRVDRRQGGAI